MARVPVAPWWRCGVLHVPRYTSGWRHRSVATELLHTGTQAATMATTIHCGVAHNRRQHTEILIINNYIKRLLLYKAALISTLSNLCL